jgi:hypothetical protein
MASATGPLAFDSSVMDMTMMHLERQPDFHEEQDTPTMIVDVRLHWKVCCLCCPSQNRIKLDKSQERLQYVNK